MSLSRRLLSIARLRDAQAQLQANSERHLGEFARKEAQLQAAIEEALTALNQDDEIFGKFAEYLSAHLRNCEHRLVEVRRAKVHIQEKLLQEKRQLKMLENSQDEVARHLARERDNKNLLDLIEQISHPQQNDGASPQGSGKPGSVF